LSQPDGDFDEQVAQRYLREAAAFDIARINPCLAVNMYLLASYLYYKLDIPLLADSDYDALCKWLLSHYEEIMLSNVWHKRLLDVDLLRAGSGFSISSYPAPIVSFGIAISRIKERKEIDANR
jgi:hypothetical protein